MNILILGNGWLGNKFHAYFPGSVLCGQRLENIEQVFELLDIYRPDAVLNCIGKTGRPNVDWCETHVNETMFSNVTVPVMIAYACLLRGVYAVNLSSGCIYEGDNCGRGFSEEDAPNFSGSVYSVSKTIAEERLKEYDVLQLRVRMPIDSEPGPRDLLTKLRGYKHVINFPNSVTCIPDLLETSKTLIEKRLTGVYNVTQSGAISHRELLEMYRDTVQPDFELPEFVSELDTLARRSNCVLSTKKLEQAGVAVKDTRQAVKDCLYAYPVGVRV